MLNRSEVCLSSLASSTRHEKAAGLVDQPRINGFDCVLVRQDPPAIRQENLHDSHPQPKKCCPHTGKTYHPHKITINQALTFGALLVKYPTLCGKIYVRRFRNR
jgi:hypothetical protein